MRLNFSNESSYRGFFPVEAEKVRYLQFFKIPTFMHKLRHFAKKGGVKCLSTKSCHTQSMTVIGRHKGFCFLNTKQLSVELSKGNFAHT